MLFSHKIWFLVSATGLLLSSAGCGGDQLQRAIGQHKTEGGISSTGDREPEPTTDESGEQSFACGDVIDLTGSRFRLDASAKTLGPSCAGKQALGAPSCIVSLGFIDEHSVELNYSESKSVRLFSRNTYSQCNGRLTVSFLKGVGTKELHDFTMSEDGQTLRHVPTNHIYLRSSTDK